MGAPNNLRKVFSFTRSKNVLHWFPFHIQHALKKLEAKLHNVDAVIEVHDARIPLTGRSSALKRILGIKPHILVLNKLDLSDVDPSKVADHLKRVDGVQNVAFVSCREDASEVRKLLPKMLDLIQSTERYNRTDAENFRFMVIGVPNTGKSSLINALSRSRRKTAVGAHPGVTRHVTNRIKVSDAPRVYVLDTPGIYEARVTDVGSGLRLALCGVLQDHKVGVEVVADYLLYSLNKQNVSTYVSQYSLPGPTDEITEVLEVIAARRGAVMSRRADTKHVVTVLNTDLAAQVFIKDFREGHLGPVWLDRDLINDSYN